MDTIMKYLEAEAPTIVNFLLTHLLETAIFSLCLGVLIGVETKRYDITTFLVVMAAFLFILSRV